MFLIDSYSISPQYTYNNDFLEGSIQTLLKEYYEAIEPSYSDVIPASLLRRMGKAVRMGVGAGMPLIRRHEKLDGIIIGTANGGMENCINFLNQIVEYEEGLLTPTNFVQSTPNAVAGQLALMSGTTAYNMTHVNGAHAFENALLDAMLLFKSSPSAQKILVGAVEEISDYNFNIDLLAGRFKQDPEPGHNPLETNTEGSVCGEGASMFVFSSKAENAGLECLDLNTICFPEKSDLSYLLKDLLERNQLSLNDIDLFLSGRNGDIRTDHWYDFVKSLSLENKPEITYKNLCGEYRTASAFGFYIAQQILAGKLNAHPICKGFQAKSVKHVLCYNHFDGLRHSFILLKKVDARE